VVGGRRRGSGIGQVLIQDGGDVGRDHRVRRLRGLAQRRDIGCYKEQGWMRCSDQGKSQQPMPPLARARDRCPFPARRALPSEESAAPLEQKPYGGPLAWVDV